MTSTNLTQEQKDRINMIVDKEISLSAEQQYHHKIIYKTNSENVVELKDETQKENRQKQLEMHKEIINMYQKDIDLLESIKSELEKSE